MLKTVADPQTRGPVSPMADGQVRLRARHRSVNYLDGSKRKATVTCERPFASAFVACTKPPWQPGDATYVTGDDQPTTYLPLCQGDET